MAGLRALTGLCLKRAGQKGEETVLGLDWPEKRGVTLGSRRGVTLGSSRGAAQIERLMVELLINKYMNLETNL